MFLEQKREASLKVALVLGDSLILQERSQKQSVRQQGRNRTCNSSATWSTHQNTSLFSPGLPLASVKTFQQCQRKHFAQSERQGWSRFAGGESVQASHRRCHSLTSNSTLRQRVCTVPELLSSMQSMSRENKTAQLFPACSLLPRETHHSGRVFLPALKCNTSGRPNRVHRACCDKSPIPKSYVPLLSACGTALSAYTDTKKGRDSYICLQCAQMGHLTLGLI